MAALVLALNNRLLPAGCPRNRQICAVALSTASTVARARAGASVQGAVRTEEFGHDVHRADERRGGGRIVELDDGNGAPVGQGGAGVDSDNGRK
jgi:hypothetical protein